MIECPILWVQAIVRSLGMLSTESTSKVSPVLAQLQMLQTLSDAWPLAWADGAAAANSGSEGAAGTRQALVPDDAALSGLQAACQRREAVTGACLVSIAGWAASGSGTCSHGVRTHGWEAARTHRVTCKGCELTLRYPPFILFFCDSQRPTNVSSSDTGQGGRYLMLEPMLALRRSLLTVLQRPDAAPAALAATARAARKAGQLNHGMAAVHQLQQQVQLLDSQHRWGHAWSD